MSYHESFWVAVSAAAPVIALAAVVVLPDTSDMYRDFVEAVTDEATAAAAQFYRRRWRWRAKLADVTGYGPGEYLQQRQEETAAAIESGSRLLRDRAETIRSRAVINVLVQAGLLAASLMALAYGRNVIAPWVAIGLAVGGILLLAWTVSAVDWYRKANAIFSERFRKQLPAAAETATESRWRSLKPGSRLSGPTAKPPASPES